MTKRITLALAALGLSATAFAGHPAEDVMPLPVSNDINLTAPYQDGMWSFGVEALYWQAGNNDFHYATSTLTDTADGLTATTVRTQTVEPEYEWGWRADVTYAFPGNGRDVTLSYTHFDGDESSSIDNSLGNTLAATALGLPDGATTFTAARGSSDDDYQAVDLTFGQKIDVGQRVRLHPFAGLRWADIDNTDKAIYTGTSSTGGATTTYVSDNRFSSEFQGIGPRFGSDAQVNLGSGFMVVGRVGMSLLIGDRDSKHSVTQYSYDADGNVSSSILTTNERISSNTRVVPEMDARLGLAYAYNWNNGTGVGIEVGWEATNYFNAVDNSDSSFGDTSGHDTDFSLQGPYLRLQLDIA